MIKKISQTDLLYFLVLATGLFSCRADDDDVSSEEVSGTRLELTQDSIFYYAKEIYLWYDQLPTYDEFAPRSYTSYTDEIDNLSEELYDLTQYAINPDTGEPYEYLEGYDGYSKYSFIEENESSASSRTAQVAISYLDGTDDDFGFALTIVDATDIRVRYVTTGSPAYEAGIRRGDHLIEVDGQVVNPYNSSYYDLIVDTFDDSTYPLKILKQDSSELEVTLVKATYTINPVFKDTVIETSSGNVGYLAFDMFTSLSNAESPLEEAFASFASENVKDLVLDLRYNGGGYLETADYMINSIIPSSYSGQTMYAETFNDLMQNGEATILENQILLDSDGNPISYNGRYANYNDVDYSVSGNTYTFSKEGSLNTVENVYVIMTGSTASASECVFNSLSPYLNVTLIGSTSYGKPVGFFAITIDDYDMYVPNFTTTNANGDGDYYAGFDPDYAVSDDVTKDFGDPEEDCFAQALSLITGDETSRKSQASSVVKQVKLQTSSRFNGMIDQRTKTVK